MGLIHLKGNHILTGVDFEFNDEGAKTCLFKLDGMVYVAKEDPQDGYRSMCEDIEVLLTGAMLKNEFPPCKVACFHSGAPNDVLRLVDTTTGLTVLEVGTWASDEEYPSFIADYNPAAMAINQGSKED